MATQRTAFSLDAGVNRPGDLPDTIVNSSFRTLPNGLDFLGAQIRVTADSFGGATIRCRLAASNQLPAVDTVAILQAESGNITANTAFLFGDVDQLVPVAQLRDLRLEIVLIAGLLSDLDNLQIEALCKGDGPGGLQRSAFELACGINRADDPVNVVVPSAAASVRKGMQSGGVQVVFTAVNLGDVQGFAVLEGTNVENPGVSDWFPVSNATTIPVTDGLLPAAEFAGPVTQQVDLSPFSLVRLTFSVLNGDLSTVDDFQAEAFFKFDYLPG